MQQAFHLETVASDFYQFMLQSFHTFTKSLLLGKLQKEQKMYNEYTLYVLFLFETSKGFVDHNPDQGIVLIIPQGYLEVSCLEIWISMLFSASSSSRVANHKFLVLSSYAVNCKQLWQFLIKKTRNYAKKSFFRDFSRKLTFLKSCIVLLLDKLKRN